MQHRIAFTLIELLLAVALSVILILLGFTVFRSVVSTIVNLKEVAAENALLRSGYLLATDDADRWHSQSNPGYPYLRQHVSVSDDSNSLYDVRPFRPVSWPASLDAVDNPNWAQPHDPRSWYRGHLLPPGSTPGRKFQIPTRRVKRKEPYFERYNTFAVDMTRAEMSEQWAGASYTDSDALQLSKITQDRIAIPVGWNTWHAIGDYASLSNIDMATTVSEGTPQAIQGWRPRQLWATFQRLGQRGCAAYLHPGSLNLISAPMDNEVSSNYLEDENGRDPRADTHFRKGEVPWDLFAGTNQLYSKEIEVLDGPRPDGDTTSYPADFKDPLIHPIAGLDPSLYNRQNYSLAFPDFFSVANGGSVGSALPLLCDFDALDGIGPHVRIRLGGVEHGGLQPMTSVYAGTPLQLDMHGRNLDWANFFNSIIDPYELRDLRNRNEWTKKNLGLKWTNPITGQKEIEDVVYSASVGHFQSQQQRWTWRQPLNITDAPQPELRQPGSDSEQVSAMATASLRYRSAGHDKVRCTIHLRSSENQVRSISFNMITTDFRGARQFWGRTSAQGVADGLGNNVTLGDRYE